MAFNQGPFDLGIHGGWLGSFHYPPPRVRSHDHPGSILLCLGCFALPVDHRSRQLEIVLVAHSEMWLSGSSEISAPTPLSVVVAHLSPFEVGSPSPPSRVPNLRIGAFVSGRREGGDQFCAPLAVVMLRLPTSDSHCMH